MSTKATALVSLGALGFLHPNFTILLCSHLSSFEQQFWHRVLAWDCDIVTASSHLGSRALTTMIGLKTCKNLAIASSSSASIYPYKMQVLCPPLSFSFVLSETFRKVVGSSLLKCDRGGEGLFDPNARQKGWQSTGGNIFLFCWCAVGADT